MTDIIERLRVYRTRRAQYGDIFPAHHPAICDEAADEIERLTAEIGRKDVEISNLRLANDEARKTIDRLCEQIPREALSAGEGRDEL